jgi:D-lactate dehydrogenase (cytochrome)
MLLVEFHDTESGAAEQIERFGEIAKDLGGGPFEWATKPEDRSRLWRARHDGYWAACALRPGLKAVSTDVCVPISRLADCVTESQRDLADSGLVAPIVGHVGDGNFHMLLLFDPDSAEEVARADAFMHRLVERALRMEGTCTGEHGIGQGKMKYLPEEHGEAALDVMRSLKRALDPKGIMNPGKIVTVGAGAPN